MLSLAISFLSFLWGRDIITGEFRINLMVWDFYSLYRFLRRFKRKLSFLFVGKWKLFIMNSSKNSTLFSWRWSAWPGCKCNQGSKIRRILTYIFYSIPSARSRNTGLNRTIARWRHFTTTTRILEFVVFLCKLRLLFLNPQRDWHFK